MAITDAGDLKGMMVASAAIVKTITGVKSVYDMAGEIPASDDDADLPALSQTATGADLPPARIEQMNNQQAVNHYWYLDLLINRGGDLHAEQEAAMPFIPLVLAKFRKNIDLGSPYVAMCQVESYRFVTISHGAQAFFAVRFLIHCRGKMAVDYTLSA